MGIYERDYIRTPSRGGVGRLPLRSVTTWLIMLNVAVFVADRILDVVHRVPLRVVANPYYMGQIETASYFSIDTAFRHAQAWRLLTCQFVHVGFMHLAMNMIGLWIFGELVESRIGRRRYSFFYLLCGMAGPFMYTALWTLGYLTPIGYMPHTNTPLVGASAGIFGVMLAAAYLEPDRLIDIFVAEIPLKYFAWSMVAIAAYTVWAHGNNDGGQAAHLGGALLGYILIRHDSALNLVVKRNFSRRAFTKDWSRDPNR